MACEASRSDSLQECPVSPVATMVTSSCLQHCINRRRTCRSRCIHCLQYRSTSRADILARLTPRHRKHTAFVREMRIFCNWEQLPALLHVTYTAPSFRKLFRDVRASLPGTSLVANVFSEVTARCMVFLRLHMSSTVLSCLSCMPLTAEK